MVHPGQVSFLDPAFPPTLGANAREPHRSVKTATGLSVAALEEAAQVADPVEVAQMADQVALEVKYRNFSCLLFYEIILGSQIDKNCKYECQGNRGCMVTYIGPSRPGKVSGSCFPASFGGSCSGTPPECQDCNRAVSC